MIDVAKLFETLSKIDVSDHVEHKNGLSYLSWAWAWITFKKYCPEATYSIKKFGEAQLPYVFDEKTGYMVYPEVTVGDLTHEMWLPVMDNSNKAMKSEAYKITGRYNKEYTVKAADMFDVNKTIMRCLVKNLAMFGLGMALYAGEDLPQESPEEIAERKLQGEKVQLPTDQEFTAATKTAQQEKPKKASTQQKKLILKMCEEQGKEIGKALAYYKVESIDDLTPEQAAQIVSILKGEDESTSNK